jgi:hypothetical protein
MMVALLPIPIINRNIPQKWLDGQLYTNKKLLNEVLQRELQCLTIKHNPSTEHGC